MSKREGTAPLPNSYWVRQDRFLAGEYPGAIDRNEASRKLRKLLCAGIDHFIDLTEHGESTLSGKPLVPYKDIAEEEARRMGLTVGWERRPIVDASIPDSPEQMVSILNTIDAALDNGKKVYVHCWGGVGRTGTVVGCWLARHGYTGDAALHKVGELWQGVEKVYRSPVSPNISYQREYVRQWSEPSP